MTTSKHSQARGLARWPDGLAPMRVVSIMSGTSIDGADAVVARFSVEDGAVVWEVIDRSSHDFPADLGAALLRAIEPGRADVVELTQLHAEVGAFYADIVESVQDRVEVDLVAISGQTLYHIPRVEPERGWRTVSTLQVGEASRITARTNLPVVSDMRQSDVAAGGGGAPMVSFGDFHLFASPDGARAVQNLGGIANVTVLPADRDPGSVTAFDTGPSNCLMDEAVAAFGLGTFDVAGTLAARGVVIDALLERLMRHPYLELAPPKTTGREVFSLRELVPEGVTAERPEDVLATLLAYSVRTITDAYASYVLPQGVDEVLLAGGGALNPTFVECLRDAMPTVVMRTFEDMGWASKDRETLAFGLMAYAAWFGLPNTLPSATGARHAVVAGRILRP